MMKINWAPRLGSVKFWLAIGPAVFLLGQAILAPFGIKLNLESFGVQWTAIINAAAGVATLLGIIIDPTTAGVGDSRHALNYGTISSTKDQQIAELQQELENLKAGGDNGDA